MYKTIYEAVKKMINEVLGGPYPIVKREYMDDDINEFIQYMIQKYFEYRMVKHNEKLLFGYFNFKEVFFGEV